MTDPVTMATMRVWRTIRAPQDPADLRELAVSAAMAGRRLVELRGPSGAELTLGWELDNPLAPDDAGGPPGATDNVILTLAACLGCCWPDPDSPVFSGEPTTIHTLRATLEPFGVKEVMRFVNCLRSWGYLAPDLGDGLVRLGPAVAVWRDADLARLRREHDQLPTPKGDDCD